MAQARCFRRSRASTLVGEARDGREAIAKLEETKPDLLFLDVQMPELDGFDVLRGLDPEALPVVVFVTAYDAHALKAFEVHALDYLLKPFERDRFRVAMERAREQLAPRGGEAAARRLVELLESLGAKARGLDRVAVKTDGVIKLVKLSDVDFIEAAGRYVTLHVGKEQHLVRETMNELEAKLDPARLRARSSLGHREPRPREGAQDGESRRSHDRPSGRPHAALEPQLPRAARSAPGIGGMRRRA